MKKNNRVDDGRTDVLSSVDISNNHCASSTSSMLETVNTDPVNKDINSDLLETEGKQKDSEMELEFFECNESSVHDIIDNKKECITKE